MPGKVRGASWRQGNISWVSKAAEALARKRKGKALEAEGSSRSKAQAQNGWLGLDEKQRFSIGPALDRSCLWGSCGVLQSQCYQTTSMARAGVWNPRAFAGGHQAIWAKSKGSGSSSELLI